MEQMTVQERHSLRRQAVKETFGQMAQPQQAQLKVAHKGFRDNLVGKGNKKARLSLWSFLELVLELQRVGAL